MATTLANGVIAIGHHLNDSQFAASQGSSALARVNTFYKSFCKQRDFAELVATDSSLTTVSGTATYTWPTTTIWRDEPFITIIRTSFSAFPYRIWPVPNMDEWTRAKRSGNAFPCYYRRYGASGAQTLEFAPTPSQTGDGIKIDGQKRVTPFVGDGSAADTTPFLDDQIDEALWMWIAAGFKIQRKDLQGAQTLRSMAMETLPDSIHVPIYQSSELQPMIL